MVAGMFHCRGGVGPDRFDALTALINSWWTTTAPTRSRAYRNFYESEAARTCARCRHVMDKPPGW